MTSKEGAQRPSTLGCPYLSVCLPSPGSVPDCPTPSTLQQISDSPRPGLCPPCVSSFPGALPCHPGPPTGAVVGVGMGQRP